MAAVFQTPGTWVLAGGGAFWSAECRAALAACGIDPDGFGTYKQRLDAQGAMREGYQQRRIADAESTPVRRPHESNCIRTDPTKRTPHHQCGCHESANGFNDFLFGQNGAPPNPNRNMQPWLTANAQSGHISGNAFYQDAGARGDPCANTRPTGYDPATGRYANTGGYGYEDSRAFCMDHYGRANNNGSAHEQITRREENQSALALEQARAGQTTAGPGFTATTSRDGVPVTQRQMEDGARSTAEIAVRGANSRQNGTSPGRFRDDVNPLTPQQREFSNALTSVQRQNGQQLLQREAAAGNVAAQQALNAANPSGPSGNGPTAAQEEKAIECIVAAWKQSLNEMRDEAINRNSTVGRSKECRAAVRAYNNSTPKPNPEARGFTDLPPDRQQQVLAQLGNQPAQRQHQLEQRGAQSAGETRSPHPTAAECREYQANWLLNQRTANGRYPPMQGSPQDTNGPPPFSPAQQAPAPAATPPSTATPSMGTI